VYFQQFLCVCSRIKTVSAVKMYHIRRFLKLMHGKIYGRSLQKLICVTPHEIMRTELERLWFSIIRSTCGILSLYCPGCFNKRGKNVNLKKVAGLLI
jgi:hypothetical protein